jgi:hypothetical protein
MVHDDVADLCQQRALTCQDNHMLQEHLITFDLPTTPFKMKKCVL